MTSTGLYFMPQLGTVINSPYRLQREVRTTLAITASATAAIAAMHLFIACSDCSHRIFGCIRRCRRLDADAVARRYADDDWLDARLCVGRTRTKCVVYLVAVPDSARLLRDDPMADRRSWCACDRDRVCDCGWGARGIGVLCAERDLCSAECPYLPLKEARIEGRCIYSDFIHSLRHAGRSRPVSRQSVDRGCGSCGLLCSSSIFIDYRAGVVGLAFCLPLRYALFLPYSRQIVIVLAIVTTASFIINRSFSGCENRCRCQSRCCCSICCRPYWRCLLPSPTWVSPSATFAGEGFGGQYYLSEFLIGGFALPMLSLLFALFLANAVCESRFGAVYFRWFALAASVPAIAIILYAPTHIGTTDHIGQ